MVAGQQKLLGQVGKGGQVGSCNAVGEIWKQGYQVLFRLCFQNGVLLFPCGTHIPFSKYATSWKLSQTLPTLTGWSDLRYLFSLVYDDWAMDGFAWEVTSWRLSQFCGSRTPSVV